MLEALVRWCEADAIKASAGARNGAQHESHARVLLDGKVSCG